MMRGDEAPDVSARGSNCCNSAAQALLGGAASLCRVGFNWGLGSRDRKVGFMTDGLPPLTPGTLYLVATPIGNLEDITLRALRTLKECDLVAAEDTRRTGLLLRHFGISKPLLSYFKFSEAKRSEEILARLGRGEKIALVTDAGSPGISDPGERVVKAAIAAGFRVEPVPGPSALVAALTASGLPAGEFHFIGFLPHKSGQRMRKLEKLRNFDGTLILYESPYRIEKLLGELSEAFGSRTVVLARELTKKFEEFLRGTPTELLALVQKRKAKGEFVVLIDTAAAVTGESEGNDVTPEPPAQGQPA